ncbi:hypothetical protein [Ruminococcus flavefaciens]|uniref:hypothetical protein n=1 Tax=Ruminococcus flavefaciens TaxID=1265 RepID=UPI00048BFAF2|nr:hypothetical protein [Ruminococcus flavefaciens]
MMTMEYYISSFLDELLKRDIKRIVCTNSVADSKFISIAEERDFLIYKYEDARSVGYIATGMSAEASEAVVICTNGDNEYRSFMPAMTEAYYRNLPVIAVTITSDIALDSDTEFNDTSYKKARITCFDDNEEFHRKADSILDIKKAAHIDFDLRKDCEFISDKIVTTKTECPKTVCNDIILSLSKAIDKECAVFIDPEIYLPADLLPDAVIICGSAGGHEGRLAYVLGASLAKKRKKYIGIVTEKSALHDINTLGNREMNNRVVYIILAEKNEKMFRMLAEDLNFSVRTIDDIERITEESDRPVMYILKQ